jgi:hypothetical protein
VGICNRNSPLPRVPLVRPPSVATMDESIYFIRGPDDHSKIPTSNSMVWVVLFRVTDEVHRGAGLGVGEFECWREVTDVRSGQKFRKHAELSEWTKDLRTKVSSAWLTCGVRSARFVSRRP